MFKEALAFAIALLPCCVAAAERQKVAQPTRDYRYECSFEGDFKPHDKVLGVLEIKKIFHADGKADSTEARLTFIIENLLHDAFPPIKDGYLRGMYITWSEDQHKELGVTLLEDSDRSAYITPNLDIYFGTEPSIKLPEKYEYNDVIITIGKNELIGKFKDGFTHFVDYYSPEVINLERLEFYGGMSKFRLEDIVNYSKGNDEICFYFTRMSVEKSGGYTTKDRIIVQRFSLDPKDLAGIDRLYREKTLSWENGTAGYKNCPKIEGENDIMVTSGSQ
ncbi:MAG: hypothetical protein ABI471_05615 [Sphingomonas bacterium]